MLKQINVIEWHGPSHWMANNAGYAAVPLSIRPEDVISIKKTEGGAALITTKAVKPAGFFGLSQGNVKYVSADSYEKVMKDFRLDEQL